MNRSRLILTAVGAIALLAPMMINEPVAVSSGKSKRRKEERKPHWKDLQSDDEKEFMLQKAEAKRERKRQKRLNV